MEPEPLIEMDGVSVAFGGRTVIPGVDLEIATGEVFALMGPSGCGKTTLLKCACGLIRPDGGRILLDGRDVAAARGDELRAIRRMTGVAFQHGALLSSMTVLDNVRMPIVESRLASAEQATWTARMKLDMVGLLDAGPKSPTELSGGMRKRAAIARALALDPRIVFLDEPTSGLDPLSAAEVDELVRTLNDVLDLTMFIVTHDVHGAFRICDRAALMSGDGGILVTSDPETLRSSDQPEVVSFLERRPPERADGKGIDRYLVQAGGGA